MQSVNSEIQKQKLTGSDFKFLLNSERSIGHLKKTTHFSHQKDSIQCWWIIIILIVSSWFISRNINPLGAFQSHFLIELSYVPNMDTVKEIKQLSSSYNPVFVTSLIKIQGNDGARKSPFFNLQKCMSKLHPTPQ